MAAEVLEKNVPLAESELITADSITPGWLEKIGCAAADPSELSPEVNTRGGSKWPKLEEASAITRYCLGCSVRVDCLIEAVIGGDEGIIRGGLITKQRKPLVKSFAKGKLTAAMVTEAIYVADDMTYTMMDKPPTLKRSAPKASNAEVSLVEQRIVDLLKHQPDTSYSLTSGNVYATLSEQLKLPKDRISYVVSKLESTGLLEKIYKNASNKRTGIAGIRLIS